MTRFYVVCCMSGALISCATEDPPAQNQRSGREEWPLEITELTWERQADALKLSGVLTVSNISDQTTRLATWKFRDRNLFVVESESGECFFTKSSSALLLPRPYHREREFDFQADEEDGDTTLRSFQIEAVNKQSFTLRYEVDHDMILESVRSEKDGLTYSAEDFFAGQKPLTQHFVTGPVPVPPLN